jgi:hypothetical protein
MVREASEWRNMDFQLYKTPAYATSIVQTLLYSSLYAAAANVSFISSTAAGFAGHGFLIAS